MVEVIHPTADLQGSLKTLGEIALQLFALLATCWGLGNLLEHFGLLGRGYRRFLTAKIFIAGLAVLTLLLLALVYVQVRLLIGSWIAFALAGIGLLLVARKSGRTPIYSRRIRRENTLMAMIFFFVFALQCVPTVIIGMENYYGLVKVDHHNYVAISQFLVERSISSQPGAAEPWTVAGRGVLDQRLGPEMILGYLASILGSDTYRVFPAAGAFFIALLAATTFWLLRALNLSLRFSGVGAIWAGTAHYIILNNFDSFLSSTSILFVFPALTAWTWQYRRRFFFQIVFPSLLLGYAFCCYVELFPFVACLFGAVAITAGRKDGRGLSLFLGKTAALTVLWVFLFLERVLRYLPIQLRLARVDDKNLAPWAEGFGSLVGWKQLFFLNFISSRMPWMNASLTAVSVLFLPITCYGLFSGKSEKRLFLGAALAGTASWLVLLLLLPHFKSYVFFKLSVSYLSLFIVLIVFGLQIMENSRRQKVLSRLHLPYCFLIGATLVSFLSSIFVLKNVVETHQDLPETTAAALATFAYVREHPHETYYVTDDNFLRALWTFYHARHSRVYIGPNLPAWFVENYEVSRPPGPFIELDGENPPRRRIE